MLQLKKYHLHKLDLTWNPPKIKGEAVSHDLGMGYSVMKVEDENNLFRLLLEFRLHNSVTADIDFGWNILTRIYGEFILPENFSAYQKEYAVRHNGILILYGILRGELAVHTASFPCGRLVLPTINPADYIKEEEYKIFKEPTFAQNSLD